MAPPPKHKRERSVPSGQTLHKFFNQKHLVSQVAVAKAKTKPGAVTNPSERTSKQPEIIVIDSDSDSEPDIVQTITAKRRKLSPKNVDRPLVPKVKVEESVTIANTGMQSKENVTTVLGQPSAINGYDNSKEGPGVISSFGVPYLLNQSRSNAVRDDIPPSFGDPFLLTSSTLKELPKSVTSEPPVASSSKTIPNANVTVDIDLTLDAWEDGDDEKAPGSAIDDDEEIEWVSYGTLKTEETSGLPDVCDKHRSHRSKDGEHKYPASASNDSSSTQPAGLNVRSIAKPLTSNKAAEKQEGNENDAFSFLMSSLKENEIWKEATVAKEKYYRTQKSKGGRQKAPFYKVLQGMPIAVDAFKYGEIPNVTAYFLTHAHSDHYTNLSSTWKHGPIYCSHGTANLIIHKLSVDKKWVQPLPMDAPILIPNTNGVTTVNAGDSAFKSSHVGSSKIFRYLHCGDFRASPRHVLHPAVKDKVIDHVYLDTTYLDPKYTFPPQPLVISACAELARRLVSGECTKQNKSSVLSWMYASDKTGKAKAKEIPKPLVVIATYSIGKERIAKAVAKALNTKIYCDSRKTAILQCQDDPELHSMLTSNPTEGFVHLVPLGSIATDQLKLYLERFKGSYDRIIGFRPTGWTYTQAAGTNQSPSIPAILASSSGQAFAYTDLQTSSKSTPNLSLYPVPYSEHSSFYELTCFAMSFTWVKMIATVNVGSEASRGKMAKWVGRWEAERKKSGRDTIVPYTNPDYW